MKNPRGSYGESTELEKEEMWGISSQERSEGGHRSSRRLLQMDFSCFVMRLLLMLLPEHVVFFSGVGWREERRGVQWWEGISGENG